MAKRQLPTVSAVLKSTIEISALSVNAIAKGSQVPQPVLHRYIHGEQDITLGTADKLCAFLGLKLVSIERE